jgi:hypothetical protein
MRSRLAALIMAILLTLAMSGSVLAAPHGNGGWCNNPNWPGCSTR